MFRQTKKLLYILPLTIFQMENRRLERRSRGFSWFLKMFAPVTLYAGSGAMKYNIYVTNKTSGIQRLHVRLRGDKLQESENYSRLLDELSLNLTAEGLGSVGNSYKNEEEQRSRRVYACLIQGDFSVLARMKPTPFAVENIDRLTYLSVYDEKEMWVKDFPVDPGKYGCVTITGDTINGVTARPSNPQPRFQRLKRGSPIPDKAIFAGRTEPDGDLYFGRTDVHCGIPCKVNTEKGAFYNWWYTLDGEASRRSGDVLMDTGYELVHARRGDHMPPNAIMTGDTQSDGPLFIGRAGGNIPCKVNVENNRIYNFWYGLHGQHSNKMGEILILTNDYKIE